MHHPLNPRPERPPALAPHPPHRSLSRGAEFTKAHESQCLSFTSDGHHRGDASTGGNEARDAAPAGDQTAMEGVLPKILGVVCWMVRRLRRSWRNVPRGLPLSRICNKEHDKVLAEVSEMWADMHCRITTIFMQMHHALPACF